MSRLCSRQFRCRSFIVLVLLFLIVAGTTFPYTAKAPGAWAEEEPIIPTVIKPVEDDPPQPASTPVGTNPVEEPLPPVEEPTQPHDPQPQPEPTPVAAIPEPTPIPAQPEGEIEQMRAFWARSLAEGYSTPAEADELIANVQRANANTIIAQMRRHGDAWYNNSIEPRAADPALAPASQYDPLAYLIDKGHAHGIDVHAWLVVSVVCRSQDPLRGHPDHVCTLHGPDAGGAERWTTATYNGTQVGDLDFGHPAAIQYMERVVQHLLNSYPDLDGVHLDFIRYSGIEYGYNDVSVQRFNELHGLPADHRPEPDNPAWGQWRRDRMTELMRRLYIRSKAIDPKIQVSIAAITWGGLGSYTPNDWENSAAYERLFQDWRLWLQEGIVDFALPMHYFDEGNARQRSWYDSWMAWDRVNTGRRTIVSGLGSWLNSRDQNIEQIRRAVQPDEQGRALPGVAFYAYHCLFGGCNSELRREFMDQLRQTVFAQPARAPEWPWIANPTHGMLQGIATIDGEIVPNAKISLVKDGTWSHDIFASMDGWYGAVELEPGTYTLIVTDPRDGRQTQYDNVVVTPGQVAFGS